MVSDDGNKFLGDWAQGSAKGELRRVTPMHDWVLITAPLAAVLYFLAFQDQFRALLSWVSTLVN
jgi:hypothetical protein